MTKNYFDFFGLQAKFAIDLPTLEASFRRIQAQVHPDKFATASSAERLQSMQTATLANEAYQTLKSPALRASYLLILQGINAISETNTVMPTDFLMKQMEWREQLEDAKHTKNLVAVEALEREFKNESKHLQMQFTTTYDEKSDFITATDIARKLIFIDKVIADTHQVIEQLE